MLKKKSKYNVAIVGARGAVGSELRHILEERKFPVDHLRIFGSSKSKGVSFDFNGKKIAAEELPSDSKGYEGIDIILSSPGKTVSKQFSPHAIKAGCMIVDNTSAFRMDPKIPLVVPEINGADIEKYKSQIIANPNCSAIIMLMAVAPLHKVNPVKRILVSTYQSTSGAGGNAMRELFTQTEEFLDRVKAQKKSDVLEGIEAAAKEVRKGKSLKREAFMHQIAFNLFSHNTSIASNGYNEEENKVVEESRKILNAPNIQICPTCIRVPVFRAHAESIVLEFSKKMSPEAAREILKKAKGVKLVDDREKNLFPMPFDASGGDDVLVGRIREDMSNPNGLALFVAGDQLRKGAALNAVQIAEYLIQK